MTAPNLPSGLYEWRWEGLDGFNTVFVNLEYDLYPGLGSIGNTVWADNNLDGIWDQATEPGIPGVVVNLWLDVDDNGILDKTVDEYLSSLTTAGKWLLQVHGSGPGQIPGGGGSQQLRYGRRAGGLHPDAHQPSTRPSAMITTVRRRGRWRCRPTCTTPRPTSVTTRPVA